MGKFSPSPAAIINDDLNALTDVPAKMGRAAKATIGDLVYAILLDNPKLSDGKPLFHADHKTSPLAPYRFRALMMPAN